MAAWEFAAGKYPNIFSTLFCIPLICLGAVSIPRKQFRAFVRGRRSRTLYEGQPLEMLLDRTVDDVREEILPSAAHNASFGDYFGYLKLVLLSALVTMFPFLFVLTIYLGFK